MEPMIVIAVAFSTMRKMSLSIGIIYPAHSNGREVISEFTQKGSSLCAAVEVETRLLSIEKLLVAKMREDFVQQL